MISLMVKSAHLIKKQVFFTIDFEDFTFDLCRSVKASRTPSLRESSIEKSFENIIKYLETNFHTESKLTLFCTGVMADRYPQLIRKISQLGHEIACHGNFHDDIDKMTPDQILKSLREAKEKLSNVSQTEVKGFRAPRFSLDKFDFKRLEAISKVFQYDSSLHFSERRQFDIWREQCPINISEIPVTVQRSVIPYFNVKTGGSYLKLFPAWFVKRSINKSIASNMTPVVYLHPYDSYHGYDLLAKWSELEGVRYRFYWYLRQMQWAALFNWKQERKLNSIFSEFQNLGRLDSLLT